MRGRVTARRNMVDGVRSKARGRAVTLLSQVGRLLAASGVLGCLQPQAEAFCHNRLVQSARPR
jgi:hypothetical protein